MEDLVVAEIFTGNIEQVEIIIIEDGLPIEENKKDTLIAICILVTLCLAYIVIILCLAFAII
jgi:hypothetical protein